jgi:diaminohydroxyphosphoribosylaminopyrimidine deaminase/5-amino-6-(5-phosphoribosylamino)uracil reductase
MKKLYSLGFRNTLVEGGDLLTTNLLKNKIFNEFYLFESQKNYQQTQILLNLMD